MIALLGLLVALQDADDPRKEFETRAAATAANDAEARFALAEFAAKHKLWDLALPTLEKVLEASPDHKAARERLGYKRAGKEWKRDDVQGRLWRVRAAVAAGVAFPARAELDTWRRKGPSYVKAIDLVLDLDHYVAAALAVDERTGLFEGSLALKVVFEAAEGKNVPATGWGKAGKGQIDIDVKKLADYNDVIAKYDRDKRAGAEVVVPPARPEGILVHELTHCFQGGDNAGMPAWFIEGMATWCAQDGHYVAFFRHQGQTVKAITDGVREHKYVYARGWAFFEYADDKHGRDKTRAWIDAVVRKARRVDEAAAEAFGLTWDELVKEEQAWSAQWVKRYRVKP